MFPSNIEYFTFEDNAIEPTRGTAGSCGYDLYAVHDAKIQKGSSCIVDTGIGFNIPTGFVGIVKGRSGLAFRHEITPIAGVIDSDYRGTVKVKLIRSAVSSTDDTYVINQGDRIAQILFIPIWLPNLVNSSRDNTTTRQDSGFGSTGR
jgi:dUTP pyrophosphatase